MSATAVPAPPGSASGRAVEISAVDIRLGERAILRDVSLSVAQGEFIAVLGPNGAGKSTLMRAILGLIAPTRGTIRVLGRPPANSRSAVGYLPQRQRFDASVRVRGVDLVALGLNGHRWGIPLPLTPGARRRHARDRVRVAEMIALVGAEAYAERAIGELSGGEQQRLLIATALVRRPRLIILDEPLDSLDIPNQAAIAALLHRVARAENVTILLVAHDVNPLAAYLDRVIYLGGGRALAGPVDEVITAPRLSELYGTPIEVLRTSGGQIVVVGQPEAPHLHSHRHG